MKSLYALPFAALLALPAQAATTVTWAEWERIDDDSAIASFWTGDHFVTVTADSTLAFRAVEATGSPYLSGPAYTLGSVANSPAGKDLIQMANGGRLTFTFSEMVDDIYMAYVSWNGQPPVTFSTPVTVDSNGAGFWGTGTAVASGGVVTFGGEAHGVLKMAGVMSFTMDHGFEDWHGFTLGITPVPLPASAPLLVGALGAIGLIRRRKA
jgi:hypothetical protein